MHGIGKKIELIPSVGLEFIGLFRVIHRSSEIIRLLLHVVHIRPYKVNTTFTAMQLHYYQLKRIRLCTPKHLILTS